MIRMKVNLLGVAGPVAAPPPGPPPTRMRQIATFVGALVIALVVVGAFYLIWHVEVVKRQADVNRELARKADLAVVKAQYEGYRAQVAELQRRKETIDTLEKSRVGPVDFMNSLGATVDKASDLYLLTATFDGTHVVLRGQSNTVESIAKFMTDLKSSGSFDQVHLQQYNGDDLYGRVSYKFTLDCLFKASAPGAPVTPARAAAATGTPTRRGGM